MVADAIVNACPDGKVLVDIVCVDDNIVIWFVLALACIAIFVGVFGRRP